MDYYTFFLFKSVFAISSSDFCSRLFELCLCSLGVPVQFASSLVYKEFPCERSLAAIVILMPTIVLVDYSIICRGLPSEQNNAI